MSALSNVVSTKVHLGNQKFISVEAEYVEQDITHLTYSVYKQYGYSITPIGVAVISSSGVESDLCRNFGTPLESVKERVFSCFKNNITESMSLHIKTIIKGV